MFTKYQTQAMTFTTPATNHWADQVTVRCKFMITLPDKRSWLTMLSSGGTPSDGIETIRQPVPTSTRTGPSLRMWAPTSSRNLVCSFAPASHRRDFHHRPVSPGSRGGSATSGATWEDFKLAGNCIPLVRASRDARFQSIYRARPELQLTGPSSRTRRREQVYALSASPGWYRMELTDTQQWQS